MALYNLAIAEMRLGDLNSSQQYVLEAVQVGKKSLPPQHPLLIQLEGLLGEVVDRIKRRKQEKSWTGSS
jgi:hypothetical protein